ncbi:MAG: arylsulfatase [Verrucomicrobia bacterium]|nr:arylsulfatase [Verrucomicrobiota bacterium]
MSLRYFARLLAIILVALLCISPEAFAKQTRNPNIIFILTDDLGYGDVGAFGQTKIKTPNIDRMAREGMKFTQHYSGSPVCAPARCVLMTGKHPGHATSRDNREIKPEGQFPIPDEEITLAELMKQSGYVTGAFGKWGLGSPESSGSPLKQGFDRFYGYNCQRVAHNLYPTYLYDNDRRVSLNNHEFSAHQKLPENADPNDPASYKQFIGKEFAPDLYAEQALRFIREHKDRPFFLYFPTIIPHLALQVPEDSLQEYAGMFAETPYPGGKSYLPHYTPRAAYAALITRMDREVGRMMELINELGLDEETIFVFTSDNGPAVDGSGGVDSGFFNSNAGMRGYKGSVYEGGIRVPTIVRWKGRIKAGTESDRVTGFEDWMPTLLNLSGAKSKAPREIDGISFAPVLLGKKQSERPFLYREFPAPNYGGQQSVRVGDWKAVRQNLNRRDKAAPNLHIELYNLKNDPAETTDVSAKNQKIVARMDKLMREQHTPSEDFRFPALDALSRN